MSIILSKTTFLPLFVIATGLVLTCSAKETDCEEGLDSYNHYCLDMSNYRDSMKRALEKYCKKYQETCGFDSPEAAESESESESSESESKSTEESESKSTEESESKSTEESESPESSEETTEKSIDSEEEKKKAEEEEEERKAAEAKKKEEEEEKKKKEEAAKKKAEEEKKRKAKAKRKNPEEEFKKCCRNNKKLVNSCKYLCSFKNINKRMMLDAFFRGTCPGYAPRHVVNCASFGVDHRACCREKKIHLHANGMCMPFCNPTMRGHIGMGAGAAPCLDVFPKIAACYKQGMPRD